MLYQFRQQGSMELSEALGAFAELSWTALLLAIPLVVLAAMLTQAFSFGAIRALEGYWRRIPLRWLTPPLVRFQFWRKHALQRKYAKVSKKAFDAIRPELDEGEGTVLIELAAKMIRGEGVSSEDPELLWRATQIGWQARCHPWHRARMENLLDAVREFPVDSGLLPTRLGNVLRSTEDGLRHVDGDLEGYVYRRREKVPARVLEQHDQFRTRLDMYCTLVFVAAFLAVLSPVLLFELPRVQGMLMAGFFLALAGSSYVAAVASARGYCVTLRALDRDYP
jgi:hypothetical protein